MKVKIILNPRSGNGRNRCFVPILREKFAPYLAGIDLTPNPEHAVELTRRAVAEAMDIVVVAGGDGTVNGVVNGIAGSGVALGIIPTGTANDLAASYRMPTNISQACDVILRWRVKRADLICVNGRYYATAGGLGFPCKIAEMANKFRSEALAGKVFQRLLGREIYLFAAMYALLSKNMPPTPLRLVWSGGGLKTRAFALMVNNQPFVGAHFFASPGAINHDGWFDVCLIENTESRAELLSIVLRMLSKKPAASQSVGRWRATELVIQTERSVAFFGDGEVFERAAEFKITIRPNSLNVIAPEDIPQTD